MRRDLNYYDTFIAVAPDSTRVEGAPPRSSSTVAGTQFALLHDHPYEHDQNEVLFAASVRGRELTADERAAAEDAFLSRPQACFRASPLPRTHGWGVHCDHEGRIALVGVGTTEYRRLANDPSLTQVAGMRSKRA